MMNLDDIKVREEYRTIGLREQRIEATRVRHPRYGEADLVTIWTDRTGTVTGTLIQRTITPEGWMRREEATVTRIDGVFVSELERA